MQSVWSGGDDRLSGAALSQTSSVSALSPLPALEVALSRSECKLFTSHVYLISLFVCLFFCLGGGGRSLSQIPALGFVSVLCPP